MLNVLSERNNKTSRNELRHLMECSIGIDRTVGIWPLVCIEQIQFSHCLYGTQCLVWVHPKTKFTRNYFGFLVVSQKRISSLSIDRSLAWGVPNILNVNAPNNFEFCKHFLHFKVDFISFVLIFHSCVLYVCLFCISFLVNIWQNTHNFASVERDQVALQ